MDGLLPHRRYTWDNGKVEQMDKETTEDVSSQAVEKAEDPKEETHSAGSSTE